MTLTIVCLPGHQVMLISSQEQLSSYGAVTSPLPPRKTDRHRSYHQPCIHHLSAPLTSLPDIPHPPPLSADFTFPRNPSLHSTPQAPPSRSHQLKISSLLTRSLRRRRPAVQVEKHRAWSQPQVGECRTSAVCRLPVAGAQLSALLGLDSDHPIQQTLPAHCPPRFKALFPNVQL